MLHLHSLGLVLSVHKTARTACGRTVPFASLALTADTDCPQCRAHAQQRHNAAVSLVASAEHNGTTMDLTALKHDIASGPKYRNAIMQLTLRH